MSVSMIHVVKDAQARPVAVGAVGAVGRLAVMIMTDASLMRTNAHRQKGNARVEGMEPILPHLQPINHRDKISQHRVLSEIAILKSRFKGMNQPLLMSAHIQDTLKTECRVAEFPQVS